MGASFANLAFLGLWSVFFEGETSKAFLISLSYRDLIAAALNLSLAGGLVALAAWGLQRLSRPELQIPADILVIISLVIPLNAARQALGLPLEGLAHQLLSSGVTAFLFAMVTLLAGGLAIWRWHRRLAAVAARGYLMFSPFWW
jgi:hypothetical protein